MRLLGLATHYVEQASLPDMHERIAKTPQRLQGTIGAFAGTAPEAKIAANLPNITKLSRRIASRMCSPLSRRTRATGRLASWRPSGRRARCPARYHFVCSPRAPSARISPRKCAPNMRSRAASCGPTTFGEGVRALLIDKDNTPQWDPPTPEEVDEEMLDILFAPLAEREGWTPVPGDRRMSRVRNHPGRAARRGHARHAQSPAGAERAQQRRCCAS